MSAVRVRFAVGPEPRCRLSFHFFWRNRRDRGGHAGMIAPGFHIKLRRYGVFRHLVVKMRRGAAFGHNGRRRELWIGWFETRDGVRGLLNGWRWSMAVDRMRDFQPAQDSDVPIVPTKPRDRVAEFEVR